MFIEIKNLTADVTKISVLRVEIAYFLYKLIRKKMVCKMTRLTNK